MENSKFSTLHLASLTNEDASGLFGKTCDIAEPLQSAIGDLPNAALVKLRANSNLFADQINRMNKSTLTPKIVEFRTQCNNDFSEIKRVTTFQTKSHNTTTKVAALLIKDFLFPYWGLSKQTLVAQQDSTKKMMLKFNSDAAIIAAAEAIDIKTIFDSLSTNNEKLEYFYNNRNQELGNRTESSSELRPAASDTYQKFCSLIELAVEFLPNTDLTNLFNQMEELRKKYHALIPKEEIITDEEADEIDTEM